ncbi:MAG TPA: hypothetical protein VGU66_05660 [Candidatus Elarobacter sp.]|nr:hypothetical protein [Candidatus Elarobacter sp.]
MIVRVIFGLVAVAFVATVRGLRRRSRRRAAGETPTITVRSGYTGLENPLYRITIELGGSAGVATFMWSRDGERNAVRKRGVVQTGTWIPLENEVDVRFDGETFEAGEFWTFPARSAADTVTLKARRRGAPSARGRAKHRR